jgi:hypothetical protein
VSGLYAGLGISGDGVLVTSGLNRLCIRFGHGGKIPATVFSANPARRVL